MKTLSPQHKLTFGRVLNWKICAKTCPLVHSNSLIFVIKFFTDNFNHNLLQHHNVLQKRYVISWLWLLALLLCMDGQYFVICWCIYCVIYWTKQKYFVAYKCIYTFGRAQLFKTHSFNSLRVSTFILTDILCIFVLQCMHTYIHTSIREKVCRPSITIIFVVNTSRESTHSNAYIVVVVVLFILCNSLCIESKLQKKRERERQNINFNFDWMMQFCMIFYKYFLILLCFIILILSQKLLWISSTQYTALPSLCLQLCHEMQCNLHNTKMIECIIYWQHISRHVYWILNFLTSTIHIFSP